MNAITKYFAGVLSVIAVGVMLIAYNLIVPRTAAMEWRGAAPEAQIAPASGPRNDFYSMSASQPAGERFVRTDPATGQRYAYSESAVPVAAAPVQTARVVELEQAPRPIVRQQIVERAPRRDWTKTALVIGGSAATGAGIGGIVGGKKGALIGTAIGGGASTLFETVKR
jgi:uncharacterized protein YcfJ